MSFVPGKARHLESRQKDTGRGRRQGALGPELQGGEGAQSSTRLGSRSPRRAGSRDTERERTGDGVSVKPFPTSPARSGAAKHLNPNNQKEFSNKDSSRKASFILF